jgi:peptide deformylase
MALLNILRYPDPRLHKVAVPVTVFDERIKLVADMAETMCRPRRGPAASQVDVHEQVVVIDVSDEGKNLQVFINPEILWASEESASTTKAACRCPASTTAWNARPA